MKGIVITTEGRISVQDFQEPLHKSLGAAVGGYIEIVRPRGLKRPLCMIVNEEGLLEQLQLNLLGSLLYGTQFHGCPIVGNIVIVCEGWTPEGYDIIGIPEDQISDLVRALNDGLETLKGGDGAQTREY